MTKYNIDEDTILSKVKKCELDRDPSLGRLRIDVHQVIAGSKLGLFIAVPNVIVRGSKKSIQEKANQKKKPL